MNFVLATILAFVNIFSFSSTINPATIPSFQLPGIAVQNSFSFSNAGSGLTERVSNEGLITLYPTGGSTFNVPNAGVVTPAYETNDTRVIVPTEGGFAYLGQITFLSPGQINMYCVAQAFNQVIGLVGDYTFKVQRNISGTWTDVSNTTTVYFERVSPHMLTNNGNGYANAALYVWNGSSYVYSKFTDDGNPNPRVVNGLPTVLAFFITGGDPYGPYSLQNTTLKLAGTVNNTYLLSDFVSLGAYQQINVSVPSSITDNTTIQFGTDVNDVFGGTVRYGNIAKIRNWQ